VKHVLMAVAIAAVAAPATAQTDDLVRIPASGSVEATADRLEAAIAAAGARVAARVDHGAAAAAAGLDLNDSQLLIFGNPQVGTPAMQDDSLAGLYLPLRVLVYDDGQGQVWLAYEDPAAMLGGLDGIGPDAPYIERMRGALRNLTSAAASE
jgi:uncharacterized protein (DUF302 family)